MFVKGQLKTLLYWIREREKIRILRAEGKNRPWTNDKVLRSYRFCNVRRMDDTVSMWLLDNWYIPYKDHPNTTVAVCLARLFNLPSILQYMTPYVYNGPVDWDGLSKTIWWRYQHEAVFNAAYIIAGAKGEDKIDTVLRRAKQVELEPPSIDTSSMERTWEEFGYEGFGSFMAGQVVADLRWAYTGTWKDKDTWAPSGPGSMRGMSRLLTGDPNKWGDYSEFTVLLGKVITHCRANLSPEITSRLEAMDYQNCLCELDKYQRTINGEGTPKRRYDGETPTLI